jgi:glycosyltransferase involved in cell wall biosynthesis
MSAAPRVLVITPRCPLPLASGTQIREYHVLQALADRAEVTLLTLIQSGEGADRIEELEDWLTVRTVEHTRSKPRTLAAFPLSGDPYRATKFNTDAFRSAVQETLEGGSFDLVWANFLNTVDLLPGDIEAEVILDEHNADVRYWESFLDGGRVERTFARLNIRRIERFRERIGDRVDGVVSVSEADATEARGWAGEPVWVMPNGVDTGTFSPETDPSETDEQVLFVGSLDVRMNQEAIEWFVRSAWPSIRDAVPDATFRIVGRNPTTQIERLAEAEGVELVGEVPSVVPYYDEASVVVAPLQYGGGTKLKVLEAMAMARPLVTTPTGASGIPIEEEHAHVREREEGFADSVVSLLENPDDRDAIGRRAMMFVKKQFSWGAVTGETVSRILN